MSDYEDDREVVDIVYDDDGTDRRAHHNALERKRRDHIKDSFVSLRDAIPEIAGEKASRGQVLNKATAYIETLRKKTQEHEKDIEALKKQNVVLEQQIQTLEKARANGAFVKPQQASHNVASIEEPAQSDSSNEPTAKRTKPTSEN